MNVYFRRLSNLILIPIMVMAIPGCPSDQEEAALLYNKAKQCYEKQNYVCAKTALEKSLEIDPDFAGAYANLGEIYLKLGDIDQAFDAYKKASALSPDAVEVQLRLANLYILNRNPEEAGKILENVRARFPENLSAAYMMAEVCVMQNDSDQAENIFKSIIQQDPAQVRAYLGLSNLLENWGKIQKAREYLETAAEHNPASLNIIASLFGIYINQQKYDLAEGLIQKALQTNPRVSELHILLANLYQLKKQWEKSETQYLQAVRTNPDDPKTYLLAANFYNSIRQPDAALDMYQKAIRLQPDNIGLILHMARFYLETNDISGAERCLNKIIGKKEAYLPARILKGEVLMARHEYEQAGQLFSDLIQKYPDSSQLYYLNGIAHLKNNEPNLAKIELGKVAPGSPDYVQTRLLLAGIFLQQNQLEQAGEAAEAVLRILPDNYEARKIMGNIYLAENQLTKAETCFESLIRLAPENAEGFFKLGILDRLQKNNRAALDLFEQALSKDPQNIDIFVHLISTLLDSNRIDTAIARCDGKLRDLGDRPRSRAVIYSLKGKLFLAQNNLKKAEAAFKAALVADSNYLPPYYDLAEIYCRGKGLDSTIEEYKKAIGKDAPQDIPHMMLGIIFSMKNKPALAEFHYRQALAVNPEFVPAANNLAYLLAENGKDLNEALRLAEKANRMMPDDPRISDTLGWVYVKLGFFDQAIRQFTQSMDHLSKNPTLYYHLGFAYYKKGENKAAKSALEKALQLGRNFAGADRAREILSKI